MIIWFQIVVSIREEYLKLYIGLQLVEKGKISYFGLARNLIRHLISLNQDDLSYSARTFISGQKIG